MVPASVSKRVRGIRGSQAALDEPQRTVDFLRDVIDSLPVGIVVLDRDLRYLLVNEKGAALNGLTVADHMGRSLMEVVPDVFPIVERWFREVFRTRKPVTLPPFLAETPAAPGRLRWWEVEIYPMFDPKGDVFAVRTMYTDVTDKVSGETQLEFTMEQLRTVLDVLPVGIAIAHDVQCAHVDLNRAMKTMLRLPPDATTQDWIDQADSLTFILDGVKTARNDLPLRQAAAAGKVTQSSRLDIVLPDGSVVSELVRAQPLMRNGGIEGAVAAYIDVSDLIRIQDELRAANRVQYDFLAMVSHELRTPMTMILGNAQLLSRGHETFDEDERRNLAAEVYREAVSLSRIVENLLLMTRIDHGDRLEPEPLVLRHICEKVIEDLPADQAFRCRLSAPNDLAVVLANPTGVEQVMRNLISNALKYSRPNESVDLSLQASGEDVIFSVADRGPGIEASDRGRIFEPFFRAESTASRSGMGIGLAVCKRLIESMKGSIWAEARPSGGSIFCFRLPGISDSSE